MKKILVIEDDKNVGLIYKRILQRAGYDVLLAPDGETGTRVYRRSPTDLVITDMVMPVKDGMETIHELTRDFPDVKIIAVSGGGVIGPYCYLLTAQRLGAKRILVKPVRRTQLLEVVGEVVNE